MKYRQFLKNALYAGILAAIWTACNRPSSQPMMFPPLDEITVDSIDISQYAIIPACLSSTDSILIVESIRRDPIMDAFSISSFQHLREGVRKGPSPNEIHNPDFRHIGKFNDLMTVSDAQSGRMVLIDPTKLDIVGNVVFKLPDDWPFVQHIYMIDTIHALVQRGDNDLSWAIINRDGKTKCEMRPELPREVDERLGDDPFDLVRAHTAYGAYSVKWQRVAIVHSHYETIEIYDFDGKLISGQQGQLTSKANTVFVMGVQTTEDAFFVNFNEPGTMTPSYSTIVRYDWNGCATAAYRVPSFVTAFTVSDFDNRIYFASYPECDYIYYFDI